MPQIQMTLRYHVSRIRRATFHKWGYTLCMAVREWNIARESANWHSPLWAATWQYLPILHVKIVLNYAWKVSDCTSTHAREVWGKSPVPTAALGTTPKIRNDSSTDEPKQL